MNNKLFIGPTIRDALLADPEVKSKAKGGVLPIWTNIDSKNDFILYSRGAYHRKYNGMGYVDECELYLICSSKDYDRSCELLVAVDSVMQSLKDNGSFQIVELLDSDEDKDESSGVYFQMLKYRIY